MGRTGKLDFSIDRVRAIDGEWIAVRYSQTKKDGGNRMLATGVVRARFANSPRLENLRFQDC